MKLTTSQFRSLIREALIEQKLSPSLKNNTPLQSPMQNKNVDDLVQRIEAAFENAVSLNLVVQGFDKHYNEKTREFDDDVYRSIRKNVEEARRSVAVGIRRVLKNAWDTAHENSGINKDTKAA